MNKRSFIFLIIVIFTFCTFSACFTQRGFNDVNSPPSPSAHEITTALPTTPSPMVTPSEIQGVENTQDSVTSEKPVVIAENTDQWQGSIDLSNLALVGFAYVEPLYSGIYDYSWNDVSEIKADDLVLTCCKANYLELMTIETRDFYIDPFWTADFIEFSIQKHFDVSSDFLQTSSFYDNEKDIFQVSGNDNENSRPIALSAELKGKQIIIEVGIHFTDPPYEPSPGDTKVSDGYLRKKGILTVEQTYAKQVKYVSFKAHDPATSKPSIEDESEPTIATEITSMPAMDLEAENKNQWQGSIDLENLKVIGYAYIRPLYMGVWEYSWNKVSEINADHLYMTCCQANYLNRLTDFEGVYIDRIAPADYVEWSIQKHFDVPCAYLETASHYEAVDDVYRLGGGFGGGYSAVAVSAELDGKQIKMEVGFQGFDYDGDLPPGSIEMLDGSVIIKKGILTVEQIYGKQVKYISFKAYES